MLIDILPEVYHCCCGCSLRTGTILIAFYFVLNSMLSGFQTIIGMPPNEWYGGLERESCQFAPKLFMLYLELAFRFAIFLPSIFLLLAVYISNRLMVTTFLHSVVISAMTIIILHILACSISFTKKGCEGSTENVVIFIIEDIISVSLLVYFIIVVKSFRSTLTVVSRETTIAAMREASRARAEERIRVDAALRRGRLREGGGRTKPVAQTEIKP